MNIICIECPKGCTLTVKRKDDGSISVQGNLCPKGEQYAIEEVCSPVRMLTSTVKCRNLSLERVPVRTSAPIPRERLRDAMDVIHSLVVETPLNCGDAVVKDFSGIIGVDLIATRTVLDV